MEESSPWIVATTDATFDRDVIERSANEPIVLDFWADWCQPCRVLAPILEEAARASNGGFVLVEAKIEECQLAADRLHVTGIPAVHGFSAGRSIDAFTGVLPRAHIQSWLTRLQRTHTLEHAERSSASDPDLAKARLERLASQDPSDIRPIVALARLDLVGGDPEAAVERLAARQEDGELDIIGREVLARARIATFARIDLEEQRRATAERPSEAETQLDLARALAGRDRFEEALEIALGLVRPGRSQESEAARLFALMVFEALPIDSEITRTFRRRLSMALH